MSNNIHMEITPPLLGRGGRVTYIHKLGGGGLRTRMDIGTGLIVYSMYFSR